MAVYQFANGPQSTSPGAITNVQTTLTLQSTTQFSASGNFIVRVDDTGTGFVAGRFEYMLATANNTGTGVLTVTRGQEGTSAASFVAGATVTQVLTAGELTGAFVRLDTGVSQTLTGPLVIPPSIGGTAATTNYGTMPVKFAEFSPSGVTNQAISSIPSGYRKLEIDVWARTTDATNAALHLTFNGDTGNNYDYIKDAINNATTVTANSGSAVAFIDVGYVPRSVDPANAFTHTHIQVMQYTDASHDKSVLSDGVLTQGYSAGNTYRMLGTGYWHNAAPAAITSATLTLGAGNFVAGSLIVVYLIP